MPKLDAPPDGVKVTVRARTGVRVTVEVTGGPTREPLKFGQGNAKLDPSITTFSLPAGWTCPFAAACLSRAERKTGRIRDGRDMRYRCYASSMEARRPSVRRSRWRNLRLLKACKTREQMARLILDSLSPFARLVRVHDAGDFWSQDYFDAWLDVAQARPHTTLYAYSKAIPFWLTRLDQVGDGHHPGPVSNLVLTASYGGAADHLIAEHRLRSARVVFSIAEAEELGLEIDHDDSHALRHGPSFALLLHGSQPAGSEAAQAARLLRDGGFMGYGKTGRVALPLTAA